jgi:ATPase subunit of ABC transporter with duplicated ATPase domains
MKIDLTELDTQFEKTDFSNREAIVALFPEYKRLQLASRKTLPKGVKIEGFTMKTPFGDKVLLENADLIIEAGRRQSLVGPNCCGKTLLFHNIVNGEIPDFPRHLHVHHCKELEPHELSETVLDTVVKSNQYLNILLRIEAHLKKLLAEPGLENPAKSNLTNNLDYVASQINAVDGYRAQDKAAKMLKVLGFDDIGQKKLVSSLSGGLRMRVALCMAFFIEADLLLLDEPTNHLDFPSVLWLENRLRGYKGSFLMVSHDRELLKNVCMSVLLMEDQKIHYYHMGFEAFEKKKALEDKARFEEIEKFLVRNKNPSPSSPIGRMVLDKRTWYKTYHQKQVALATKFTFPASTPLTAPEGDTTTPEEMTLINLENVRFSYDVSTGHFIFNDPISFRVKASTRVGVMGPNGAGKSTLLKLLTKKLIPTEGSLFTHPDYKLAYFGQHSTAELDLELTAFDYMVNSFPAAAPANLRNHLGKTGIVGDVADTRMKGLSYSQRSCIVFSKLTYAGPHLLIMDEPTNFLDLESVDSLIGACNKYKGALLLVSHNRDFLKKCARQYLSVVPGQFLLYDDLKSAEKGTYSFISDLEGGGKVGKDALQNTPGGGTVHASQKVAPAGAAPKAAPSTLPVGSASSTPAASPAVSPLPSPSASPSSTPATTPRTSEALPYTIGEKVQAKFKDGKWYPAIVKGCKANSVTILYTGYGNTETQALTTVRAIKSD